MKGSRGIDAPSSPALILLPAFARGGDQVGKQTDEQAELFSGQPGSYPDEQEQDRQHSCTADRLHPALFRSRVTTAEVKTAHQAMERRSLPGL
jgi:hypothetical protein